MATIVQTPSGTYKALVRMKGWPTTSKTFRLKRDAVDWARRTEDEMVRGVYISRSGSERLTVQEALQRYLNEVAPTKKPTTQRSESITAQHLIGLQRDVSVVLHRMYALPLRSCWANIRRRSDSLLG